jgi:hypothetical protein
MTSKNGVPPHVAPPLAASPANLCHGEEERTVGGIGYEYELIPEGTPFRAIAVHNPNAIRIILGAKTIETRTWTTDYRGPLLICSTSRPRI